MDIVDHGLSHTSKCPGAVANRLTGIKNVLKCFCIFS